MGYLLRKLLFGLVYALGIDVIQNPHKYSKYKPDLSKLKQKKPKFKFNFKRFLAKVVFATLLLIGLSFFLWFFILAIIIVAICTLVIYLQRGKPDNDKEN